MLHNRRFYKTLAKKIALIFFISLAFHARGQEITQPDLNKIADVIYKIEGGINTHFPYGIKSIDTHGDITKARQICITTIRNNLNRWHKQKSEKDFFNFLGDRYCSGTVDPKGNFRWKKNIHSMLDAKFIAKINNLK